MKTKSLYALTLALPLLVCFQACKVALIADYKADMAKEISTTARTVDAFYLNMLASTQEGTGQRQFKNFAQDYANIQADLNSILQKNKARPLNGESISICQIAANYWTTLTERHRNKELTDARIEVNRLYLRDLFFAMLKAEEAKKLKSKTIPEP
jgi:hypothetical protein